MDALDFIKNSIPWVFSGIGVFIIGLFIKSKTTKRAKAKDKRTIQMVFKLVGILQLTQE